MQISSIFRQWINWKIDSQLILHTIIQIDFKENDIFILSIIRWFRKKIKVNDMYVVIFMYEYIIFQSFSPHIICVYLDRFRDSSV